MGKKNIGIIKSLKKLIFFQIFILLLTNIIFADSDIDKKQLIIDTTSEIYEGQFFSVSVYSLENNSPKYQINSTIFFNNKSYKITNENPEISIKAPDVIEDTIFEISAKKDGYNDTNAYVMILNLDNENQSKIIFTILNNDLYIDGNTYFSVLITDERGNILPDVQILIQDYFNNNPINITNDEGKAYILAPNDREEITIIGQKDGYIDGSKTVFININYDIFQQLIKNQYFIIFIAIVILILSILLVNKNKKLKNNKRNKKKVKNIKRIDNKNQNKQNNKDFDKNIALIKESKVEEIRINKKNYNDKIISIENNNSKPKIRNKNTYKKKKEDHWIEGIDEIREKIDDISIPIKEKRERIWFEGQKDIEKLIDEKIKKKKIKN